MQKPSWIHLDEKQSTININLNSEHGQIVKIAPGAEPEMVDNNLGLVASPMMKPFQYIPNTGEAEGFRALKNLLMDTTPAGDPERYFLLCWAISAFLIPYFPDRILLQLIGRSAVGKSQTLATLSMLFYGAQHVGRGMVAPETRMAMNSPLLFIDNLESRELHAQTVDFMLFMANGAHKLKSKTGSDTEALSQKMNAMCAITAIEPFPEKYPELINRTHVVELCSREKRNGFEADTVLRGTRDNRDLMLSAIFILLGKKILPQLGPGRMSWSGFLMQPKYAERISERLHSHLEVMAVILEALLEHIPWMTRDALPLGRRPVEVIVDHWLTSAEGREI